MNSRNSRASLDEAIYAVLRPPHPQAPAPRVSERVRTPLRRHLPHGVAALSEGAHRLGELKLACNERARSRARLFVRSCGRSCVARTGLVSRRRRLPETLSPFGGGLVPLSSARESNFSPRGSAQPYPLFCFPLETQLVVDKFDGVILAKHIAKRDSAFPPLARLARARVYTSARE